MLVDFDHFSLDLTRPSTAAGWIEQVRAQADGLWGRVRWTAAGAAAVQGGDYRFVSPVFSRGDLQKIGEGKYRPMGLSGAGLTNAPNMRTIQPITNRLIAPPTARPEISPVAADAEQKCILVSFPPRLNRPTQTMSGPPGGVRAVNLLPGRRSEPASFYS